MKKTLSILTLCTLVLGLTPSTGLSWHGHRHYGYNHHHSRHGGDGWVWGLSGLILGGMLVAAVTQPVLYPPPPPSVAYAPSPATSVPPQAEVYSTPPAVPPGMCRWERYILDGYGQPMRDQYGELLREYTLGSCQSPPQ